MKIDRILKRQHIRRTMSVCYHENQTSAQTWEETLGLFSSDKIKISVPNPRYEKLYKSDLEKRAFIYI